MNRLERLTNIARLLDELEQELIDRRTRMLAELDELLDTAPDDSFTQEVRDWRDQWFGDTLYDKLAGARDTTPVPSADEEPSEAAPEPSPEDIDDTFGAGTSSLLQEEARSADGGIFREGGLTAGGIFGDVPVPTSMHDPAAEVRAGSAGLRPRRRPEQLPNPSKQQLKEERRKRLLKDGSDE